MSAGFSPQFRQYDVHPIGSENVRPADTFPSQSQITIDEFFMPSGVQGTFAALDLMASAVRGEFPPDHSGFRDEFNYRAAMRVISAGKGCAGNDDVEPLAALFNFVRDQISYINHPAHMQVVQDCKRTLLFKSGDCVSKSVCLSTLLASVGILSRFVAQYANDNEIFNHVYLETENGIALDSIADGKQGRPLYRVGDRHALPDGGFEMSWPIFL